MEKSLNFVVAQKWEPCMYMSEYFRFNSNYRTRMFESINCLFFMLEKLLFSQTYLLQKEML